MKTPSELIYAYERGERAPDDAFLRAAKTLDHIQALLSGQEWDSDTCNAIAGVMAAQGYEVADLPTVPAGATHLDPYGYYWSIQDVETNTGEIWAEDHWQVLGFSDSWFDQMEEL